jgi:hypothetical protein
MAALAQEVVVRRHTVTAADTAHHSHVVQIRPVTGLQCGTRQGDLKKENEIFFPQNL